MNTWVKRRLMALGMLDEAETQFRIVEAFVRDPEPNGIMDLWRYAQHLFASLGELTCCGAILRALLPMWTNAWRSPSPYNIAKTSLRLGGFEGGSS